MKAIQTKQYGGEEELEMVEVPKPRAAAGQVVVRIVVTSFNPIEPYRTSGNMRQIFPLQFLFHPER
jgi:NADPH:quinone reductase-like Zn-dependent oxidoreductase